MKRRILLSVGMALSLFSLNISAADYYVKTTGTGDGSSWETATTLDGALASATTAGDVIHIAAGTYVPTVLITGNAGSLREKTFEIKYNISLIGGYPENATTGAVADHAVNPTVLSGELTTSYSAYHVVTITAPVESGKKVRLQGLTIKKTDATASTSSATTGNGIAYPRNYGGGIIVAKSTVELTDCIISDNLAQFAAGVYAFSNANITLNKCNIKNNTANAAAGYGGGITVAQSTIELTDCIISDNQSVHAGGVYANTNNNITFRRCSIKGNSATNGNGGGIWVTSSSVYMYDSNISNNSCTGTAAGLYIYNSNAKFYIYNTTINNNTATQQVAGAYIRDGAEGYFVNCTIYGNTSNHASAGVGGIAFLGNTDKNVITNIINSTITNNTGSLAGGINGSISGTGLFTTTINNSIISGNSNAKDIGPGAGGTHSKLYSIISDKVYDAAGEEIADVSFDASTMLDILADNGGKTQTCLLKGSGNPAYTYGMTSTQLTTLAGTFTPAIPTDIITNDQIGNSRSSATTIGAVLKKNDIGSSIPSVTQSKNILYTNNGILYIKTVSGENVTVYSISGQPVKSLKATGNLTEITGLANGLYIVKIDEQSYKVRL